MFSRTCKFVIGFSLIESFADRCVPSIDEESRRHMYACIRHVYALVLLQHSIYPTADGRADLRES